MYANGQSVPQDHAEAERWYRKAADQGHQRAQLLLGTLYEKGLGLRQSPVQALDWYRKAAGLSKDRVVYLSQALAMARASRSGRAGNPGGHAKARAQTRKVRSARKSLDRQVRTANSLERLAGHSRTSAFSSSNALLPRCRL